MPSVNQENALNTRTTLTQSPPELPKSSTHDGGVLQTPSLTSAHSLAVTKSAGFYHFIRGKRTSADKQKSGTWQARQSVLEQPPQWQLCFVRLFSRVLFWQPRTWVCRLTEFECVDKRQMKHWKNDYYYDNSPLKIFYSREYIHGAIDVKILGYLARWC